MRLAALLLGSALGAGVVTAYALDEAPRGDAPSRADDSERQQGRDEPVRLDELRPRPSYPREVLEKSLARGLAWLATRESRLEDGSWPTDDTQGDFSAPVAVTSLASLALMAGGDLPGRGPHGERVQRGLEYLLSRAVREEDDPRFGYISDGIGRMHGHGFATLALAQGYAMSANGRLGGRVRASLEAAVHLIERTQGAEGGWMYEPRLQTEHEGSVTICLVSALRAARDAGVLVDADVVLRAEDYVLRSQDDDGMFRYTLGSDKKTLALTAAALATLEAAGHYDDPAMDRGLDAIVRLLAKDDWPGKGDFPHYERLYLALALWGLRDHTTFDAWFADELQRLVASQNEDGSWGESRYGACYATAVNCLVLALPDGQLPIFQR
ncbi:MAG: hypothetical protein R3F34_17215 [Planctomycetota bacterium]